MKPIFFLFAFIFIFSGPIAVFASAPEYIGLQEQDYPRIEISLAGGLALQTGYLTTQASVGTYIFGVNFRTPGGLISFDWQGFDADHDTGEFPLNNQKTVKVSTFSFIPHVRVLAEQAWNAYLGVGFSQIGLYQDSPDYRVSYGGFMLSGLLRYELDRQWSLLYKTQWYNVNKTENDQKTSFEVWNHALGAGYSFR